MVPADRGHGCCTRSHLPVGALVLLITLSCLSAAARDGIPATPHSASIAGQHADEPLWISVLRNWRTAVDDHQPGVVDAPVVGLNAWSPRNLTGAVTYLVGLRDAVAKARRRGVSGGIDYLQHRFTLSDIEDLLGVSEDEAASGNFNRLLKRAAILHTDIATVLPGEVTPFLAHSSQVVRAEDGRARGFEGTMHWEMARMVLDAVTPSPAADEFVRRWYRATTAVLQLKRTFAYAEPHLERARALLPKDPVILFASGCLYEVYAAPRVQAIVRSADPRLRLNVGSTTTNRRRAEQFFREALTADPALSEARLHLGRVIGLLGRHDEAIAELQKAVGESGEALVRYYGEMFLGSEERALGRDAAARAHYERAAQIYPAAPSPYVALSELGRRAGDRSAALGAMQRALTAASDREQTDDPWWHYDVAAFRRAEDLLASCRRDVSTGAKR